MYPEHIVDILGIISLPPVRLTSQFVVSICQRGI